MNDVMKLIKQFDCVVLRQEINLFCDFEIGIPQKWLEAIMFKLRDMKGVEIEKRNAGE
jgi:hypothetical protein